MRSERRQRIIEEKVMRENLVEISRTAERVDKGTGYGLSSIIFGLAAFFLPAYGYVIAATIGATLAVVANHHGNRRIGMIGGAIALCALLYFFMIAGRRAAYFAGTMW